jgi:hypothetical protein
VKRINNNKIKTIINSSFICDPNISKKYVSYLSVVVVGSDGGGGSSSSSSSS